MTNAFFENKLFAEECVVIMSKPTTLLKHIYDAELKKSIITDETTLNVDSSRFISICSISIDDTNQLYSHAKFSNIDDYINTHKARQ